MANILGGLGDIVGGIGSIFSSGQSADAFKAESSDFNTAAEFAQMNALLSGEVGGLQELATARQIQHTQGTQVANTAANGLKVSGSAVGLIRDSTTQGSLAEGQIGLQTAINVVNFEQQSEALIAQGKAAQAAASSAQSGAIGGIGKILGGLFSLF